MRRSRSARRGLRDQRGIGANQRRVAVDESNVANVLSRFEMALEKLARESIKSEQMMATAPFNDRHRVTAIWQP